MGAVRQLEIVVRKPRGPLDSPLGARLRKIEARITSNEGDSIEARWEFGRELLDRREGKQLPKGILAAVVKEHNIGRSEIAKRMKFAEQYRTKVEVCACAHTYRTWNRITREALPKNPTRPKADTFEQRMTDRVTRMINETKTAADRKTLANILADAAQQLQGRNR